LSRCGADIIEKNVGGDNGERGIFRADFVRRVLFIARFCKNFAPARRGKNHVVFHKYHSITKRFKMKCFVNMRCRSAMQLHNIRFVISLQESLDFFEICDILYIIVTTHEDNSAQDGFTRVPLEEFYDEDEMSRTQKENSTNIIVLTNTEQDLVNSVFERLRTVSPETLAVLADRLADLEKLTLNIAHFPPLKQTQEQRSAGCIPFWKISVSLIAWRTALPISSRPRSS